ncbi:hypothetical protein BRADI_2g54206v3 [Brachypodium distachyon]|uniref:Uncharacterized protein n=1 Tax=Brachypodium distachyon TaxID=15368 RepID=A0A2K2DFT7_BRADI|nr:hypothetical protein BRADI_2g54206v3 [Brachypodium distachyon]
MTPEMSLEANRTGYAFITPDPAEIADQKAFIRSAIHAAAPDLQFELLATTPMVAEMCLRFATAEDRAAAIATQPFELDGFTVEVVREGEQRNCYPAPMPDYLAHINLLNYPKEERAKKDIGSHLGSIGHVEEIDPACFDAPDLSPVGVVVQLQDPRDIPRELRIRYVGWYGSGSVCPREVARNIIPIEVVEVWD